MRHRLLELAGGIMLLDDSYNSNPASVRAALETLSVMATGRIVAVLGDMLELGESSPIWHERIGRLAAQMGVKVLILVGEFAEETARGAMDAPQAPQLIHRAESPLAALEILERELKPGDWVLVKASRAVGMEEVAQGLMEMASTGGSTATAKNH
jgi:UDP-N-acetylmuramyl pentapeptide synthase